MTTKEKRGLQAHIYISRRQTMCHICLANGNKECFWWRKTTLWIFVLKFTVYLGMGMQTLGRLLFLIYLFYQNFSECVQVYCSLASALRDQSCLILLHVWPGCWSWGRLFCCGCLGYAEIEWLCLKDAPRRLLFSVTVIACFTLSPQGCLSLVISMPFTWHCGWNSYNITINYNAGQEASNEVEFDISYY